MNELNIFYILIATTAGFVISELWYSSAFLGNRFLYLLKKTKIDLKNPTLLWISQFLSVFAIAYALELLKIIFSIRHLWGGVVLGGAIALLFIVPIIINDTIRQEQSYRIMLINIGHRLVQLMTMGGILGSLSH